MNKLKILERIRNLYKKENINIIDYLKSLDSHTLNSVEDIMISYDFQAGTYTEKYFADPALRQRRDKLTARIAKTIDSLPCGHQSIFEAGVGEATGFAPLMQYLEKPFVFRGGQISHGRELSMRRNLLKRFAQNPFLAIIW